MKNKILIFLLAIYIFFMIIVQIDVYTAEITLSISILSFIISLLCSYLIFKVLDLLYIHVKLDGKPFKSNIKVFFICTLVSFSLLTLFLIIVYPGCVHGDSYNQFYWAYENVNYGKKINNVFPVISTIIMYKIPMLFYKNIKFTTIVSIQQLLFSLSLGFLCYKLNKNNANKFVIVLTLLSIFLNINVFILYTANTRDVMVTSAAVVLFAKCIDLFNKKYKVTYLDFIFYFLLIAFLYLFRYNTILSLIILSTVLILKFKNKIMKFLLIPCIILLVTISNYITKPITNNNALFRLETFKGFYWSWIQAYKDEKDNMNLEFINVINNIINDESIDTCFLTLDEYAFKKPDYESSLCIKCSTNNNLNYLNNMPIKKIIKYSLYTIKVAPQSVLYSFAKNTDIAFTFVSGENVNYLEFDAYEKDTIYEDVVLNYDFKPLNTKLYNKFLSILSFFQNHDLIYAIFGSIGIRMLIYVILCLYFIKKDWHKSLISLPFILYTIPTMLGHEGRDYRYFLFVAVLIIPAIWLYFHEFDKKIKLNQV